ncbi:MAG: prolipoprotein diacylglyceryl transferase [Lachnospiraceae bacterium]|nr:prolipoprotein diacylglyceryl transferase [Lachnospiraceae bacterium]
MDYQIYFPHLGIYFEHVIKSFSIGGFSIAVYGVTMAMALLCGLLVTNLRAKETKQNSDHYFDLFICFILFGFLGARLYYVACTWSYYREHLNQILNFRGGGIAIYGGLIAGIIVVLFFSRRKKMPVPVILDTVVMGVCAGQIIGRWGNFFNREAFGGYTDGLLAMQLPVSAVRSSEITQTMLDHIVTINGVDFIQVHPTFLYEGLWNLVLLLLLFLFRNKTAFHGEIFCRYLIGYGLGRFWIESLRTDQLWIPGTQIPISMAVSAAAVTGALIAVIIGRRKAAKT